ncbi:hypothetical protein QOT17_015669 [Balamuthia mandrillaris]
MEGEQKRQLSISMEDFWQFKKQSFEVSSQAQEITSLREENDSLRKELERGPDIVIRIRGVPNLSLDGLTVEIYREDSKASPADKKDSLRENSPEN